MTVPIPLNTNLMLLCGVINVFRRIFKQKASLKKGTGKDRTTSEV